MAELFRENPLRLAFGLMRLPKNPDGSIDIPQVCEMTDRFIAAGGTYFDTAYVYDGGGSEKAFKAAVADRYPRNAYTVATKLNAAAADCKDEQSAKQQSPAKRTMMMPSPEQQISQCQDSQQAKHCLSPFHYFR